jgi:HAD superfamily hydrolase (TIGR01459 family)
MSSDLVTLEGLAEVADLYEGFIVDIFGVLHDGIFSFPWAIDCLARLRGRGKRIVLLSNSPRRCASITRQLGDLEIASNLYDGLVSSGELVFEALSNCRERSQLALGSRYFHWGPAAHANLLEGTGRTKVTIAKDADFVLVTGSMVELRRSDRDDLLQALSNRDIPMVCANPDHLVLIGSQRLECAGAIASSYEALGGRAFYFGKPHRAAYDHALRLLQVQPSSVLAIGDGMATDICGAKGVGLDSVLIASGIHQLASVIDGRSIIDVHALMELIDKFRMSPRFVLARLNWH